MPARIGLRHLLLGALLLGVVVLVWLNMLQLDRVWRRLDAIESRLKEQTSVPSAQPATKGDETASEHMNDDWARPGIPIVRPQPRAWVHDPRHDPGFAPGGTITEAFEASFGKVTPYIFTDTFARRVIDCVCEKLADYDPQTLELKGILADAWQVDPAGKWLRVHLVDNARFSTGEPVTARDVEFTYALIFNPRIDASRFRSTDEAISGAKAISDRCVEFTFSESLYANIDDALRLWVLPEKTYKPWIANPDVFNKSTGLLVGSGPYMLQRVALDSQWTPGGGTAIELVRNPHFRGIGGDPAALPPADKLRFVTFTDARARLTAFDNGQVDLMRPSPEQVDPFRKDPDSARLGRVLVWFNMQSPYSAIWWNCGQRNGQTTPFSDPRVRRAMTQMLDRERIVRDFLDGQGLVASASFREGGPQADPTVHPWPFDMAAAGKLLDDAGWKLRDGSSGSPRTNSQGKELAFDFVYASGPIVSTRLGAYVKDQAAALGIRVTLRPVDNAATADIRSRRDFDALLQSYGPSAPETDPFQFFHSTNIPNGGDNFCQWSNPRADALMAGARRELDNSKRNQLWHELHQLIHQEQPFTMLFHSPWVRFASIRLQNVHTYPSGLERFEWWIKPAVPAESTPGSK